jgi:3-hydroxyisobutyrate dehydrogenase-like beta-hydroxyacid dehydrogenase
MSETVALIGVGALGKALLKQLHKAGKRVQAYDVEEAARQFAHEQGAVVKASAAAAALGATHIHVLVASDTQAPDATTGQTGALTMAAAGCVLLLHSTILPETTRAVGKTGAEKGVRVIDAPITGVPHRLETGQGMFLVGGAKEDVEDVRSYLLKLGSAVHHFGPLGAGNVAKLAKNLYNASERVLLAEILNLVAAGGLDIRQFLEMQIAAEPRPAVAEWARNFDIAEGHARPRPTTNLFGKDVMLAATLSRGLSLNAPLTEGVQQTAERWLEGWGQHPKT